MSFVCLAAPDVAAGKVLGLRDTPSLFLLSHCGAAVEMESARNTLQKLMAGVLNRFPAGQVPLETWPFVCGKQVARRTRALEFADGVLRIEVPDAGWRAQLEDLSATYLAGLNRYSATRVERIEFVVAASGAETPRRTGVSKPRKKAASTSRKTPAKAKKKSAGKKKKP